MDRVDSSKTKYTALYDKPPVYRGDTIGGMNILITDEETERPLIPESVCAQLRNSFGKLIYQMESHIDHDRGIVSISPIPGEATAYLIPATYKWDVEYRFSDGRVRTYVSGSITILRDVSQCQT